MTFDIVTQLRGEQQRAALEMDRYADAARTIEQLRKRVEKVEAINGALLAALETARNGLDWYQDAYPGAVNACDDEAMTQIDAALAKANQDN